MKNELLKYILDNGKLEPNKLGITEVYIDDDERLLYGSKNNKTVLSIYNYTIDDIKQEIEDSKFFIKLAKSELKQARDEYEAVKNLGSPKFNQKVKDAKEFLYYTERRIYVNKYIIIPYFEYHLRVQKGKKELNEENTKLLKLKGLAAKAKLKLALI